MEIDPKYKPIIPPGTGKIDPQDLEIPAEKAGSASGKPPASDSAPPTEAPADPLWAKLAPAVQSMNLDNPQERVEAELLILRETMVSVYGNDFFQGLDMETMLQTFRDFVDNDPTLKEMFQNLIQSLGQPAQ